MKVALRRSISGLVLGALIAVALLLLFSSSDTDNAHADNNFSPFYTRVYCNALSASFPDATLQGDPSCTTPLLPSTSAPRLQTSGYGLPRGDLNFSNLVIFEPNGVKFTPGCNVNTAGVGSGVNDRLFADGSKSSDDDIDNDFDGDTDHTSTTGGTDSDGECLKPGDKVGGSRNLTTLGILNGKCAPDEGTVVDFVFYNVAIPNVPSNPRTSTNIYTPPAEGTSNRFASGATDGNTDNLADADSAAILKYPDWLLDLFDADWDPVLPPLNGPQNIGVNTSDPRQNSADGAKKPLMPLAVYGGLTKVAGTWVPLYFVQFASGVMSVTNNATNGFSPPHPFSLNLDTIGAPSQTILNDASEAKEFVSTVTDFCTPLTSILMLLGTTLTNTQTRAVNPSSAGSHPSFATSASFRDLDNDTFENSFDTCPLVSNIDPDTRDEKGPTGESPGDLIDSACDLNPTTDDGSNADSPETPAFLNGQDNCPQLSNGTQEQAENQGAYSTSAPDGGPKGDDIGDACDMGAATFIQNSELFSGTSSGSNSSTILNDTGQSFSGVVGKLVRITGGTGKGQVREITGATGTELTISTGSTDWETGLTPDGTSTYIVGNSTTVTLADDVANGHYHASGLLAPTCYTSGSSVDADGDGWCAATTGETDTGTGAAVRHPSIDIAVTAGDADGDGFDAFLETFMGTDPTKACNVTSAGTDEPLDATPTDFDDDRETVIFDLDILKPALFTFGGGAGYDERLDMNADTEIDIFDLDILKPALFGSCSADVQQ